MSRRFPILGRELMALNGAKYMPRISVTFLAHKAGLAESTVRYTLQRFVIVGLELKGSQRQRSSRVSHLSSERCCSKASASLNRQL